MEYTIERNTYADFLTSVNIEHDGLYPCPCGRDMPADHMFDVREYNNDVVDGHFRCGTCISHQDRVEKQQRLESIVEDSWADTCELANTIKAERISKIQSVKWIRERHADEIEMGLSTSLTPIKYLEFLRYIQDLRDINITYEKPSEVIWPEFNY